MLRLCACSCCPWQTPLLILCWCLLSSGGDAADSTALRPHGPSSAFVHLFEWSWADVAAECERWLGPKGFTAVQVSPPTDHKAGEEWYVRYQPVSFKLVSRSGGEAEFRDMVQRCNSAGVGVYTDAVLNHVAWGEGTSVAGTQYSSRQTPEFSPSDFHHINGNVSVNCIVSNYDDVGNVQNCDLLGLPDLCTECPYVQDKLVGHLQDLQAMGVSGIRIDAAKHQAAADLQKIIDRIGGDFYVFSEVIQDSSPSPSITAAMYCGLGSVTDFSYGRRLGQHFSSEGQLMKLEHFAESLAMPSDKAVVFVDNHDNQRGHGGTAALTHKTGAVYTLAVVFMLAHPFGYPRVMSSYDFANDEHGPPGHAVHNESAVSCGAVGSGSWICEHRSAPIANMVAWRRAAGGANVTSFRSSSGDRIAFCRGASACIALNRGSSAWNVQLTFSLPKGRYCDIIQSDDDTSCPTVDVAADGTVFVKVPPLGAVALHVGRRLAAAPPEPPPAQETSAVPLRSRCSTWWPAAVLLLTCAATRRWP